MKTKDKVTSETYRWQFELTGVMLFPSQIPLKGSELYPAGRKVFNVTLTEYLSVLRPDRRKYRDKRSNLNDTRI